MSYEKYKDLAKGYAGPAVMEIFGEQTFAPLSKVDTIALDSKQQKLAVAYSNEAAMISNEFIPNEETSFTIIAYPIPDIGEKFEEIFAETVKVNTLDNDKYKKIQQCIIDALDEGDYVTITGANGNNTNINVKLYELKDKDKETIFENCTADVNIPVGEVFTSPVLKGTNGILHVKKVYLRDLKYVDLQLKFADGMISEYTCKNYEEEDENQRYIKENLLHNHDSLPLGEFAIGTNTTAYVMGEKYGISEKLPILIAEKTGPHFAIGDTCYSMSEEVTLYNPDGKEIVAKDNEHSRLRKEDMSKAYFNCHTDITIPYHELGDIIVYTKNGDSIIIIKDGRFVLKGTEELNQAFAN
jgi:leucyl aminopeptidase (aminopeptidase T)